MAMMYCCERFEKTTSVDTIALLRRETPTFIGPELWPANSPDLNPVDYRIWGLIQERIYQRAIRDIDEFKEHLIVVWAELKQSVIDNWSVVAKAESLRSIEGTSLRTSY